MSELTETLKEYRKITDDLKSENKRYYMAMIQSLMLLRNKAVDDALQTIKTALGEE